MHVMYVIFAFILNLPWTVIGFMAGILSIPQKVWMSSSPLAFVFRVKSLWWCRLMPGKKGIRAAAIGHIVLLGPLEMEKDLEHELIHVEQAQREPFVHFFLYNIEYLRKGYRQNKYEIEAYDRAGNVYKEK